MTALAIVFIVLWGLSLLTGIGALSLKAKGELTEKQAQVAPFFGSLALWVGVALSIVVLAN